MTSLPVSGSSRCPSPPLFSMITTPEQLKSGPAIEPTTYLKKLDDEYSYLQDNRDQIISTLAREESHQ